jgi:hypothetical protein
MKFAAKNLLLLIALAATTLAPAQTLPHFQHIIILFQENRTPDNLFVSIPITAMAHGRRFGLRETPKAPCATAVNRCVPIHGTATDVEALPPATDRC